MRISTLKIVAAAALAAASFSFAQVGAKITATAADLQAKYGTSKIKVVFLNQGSMYYVDFSEAAPQIRKMAGVSSAFYPVISSDGKLVTFQTGLEAEGPYVGPASAKVWVRDLAEAGTPSKVADTGYVPRFVQHTPADAPEIIYSTGVNCPGGICYNVGKTVKRKLVGKVAQAPETVFDGGNYYGGISWDNRYLVTAWEGGPNCFMLDLVSGGGKPSEIHTIKVKKTGTDADTTVALGACNISRSASRIFTNAVLYFDFGSAALKAAKTYHPLLGTWEPHEKLFISSYGSQDLKVYDMPADRKTISSDVATGVGEAVGKKWNNPEWSNHPYFAVASLTVDRLYNVTNSWKHTLNTEAIYLMNLKDSSYVKIIESTDTSFASKTNFGYPFVWVDVPQDFQESPTWLSKTIWGTTAGVIASKSGRHSLFSGDMLSFDPSVTGINIYSVTGSKLTSIDASGKNTNDYRKIFYGLQPGIYFIGLESQGESQRMIRWLKTE